MFEGRFGELLVIFVLALVILGPEKLPKVVAEFGRWVGRARTLARQFREQLEEEVRLDEVRKAQAAAPKPTPVPVPVHDTSQPPVEVAEAMNPHTHPSSPIDVSGLPPALAQAALFSEAAAQVPEALAPVATQVTAAPAPATPQPLSEAPHP
jgi:sec-independent protein translocase protein TatB